MLPFPSSVVKKPEVWIECQREISELSKSPKVTKIPNKIKKQCLKLIDLGYFETEDGIVFPTESGKILIKEMRNGKATRVRLQ